ncbi:putative phosphoglycerate mutase pmu1 [Rhizina undulata]
MLLPSSLLTLVGALSLIADVGVDASRPHQTWKSIKKSTVTGFFAQDLASTNATTFDFKISSNFGLLNKFNVTELGNKSLDLEPRLGTGEEEEGDVKKAPWRRFEKAIGELNRHAPKNTAYKVLYLARHGQGYHNVAESYYGTPLWDCYWSKQDGNGNITWADALLTPEGEQEALKANAAWKTQIEAHVPLPDSFYSSPLRRAANTLLLNWRDITPKPGANPTPIFKEKLRETIGIHTDGRRNTSSYLHATYPTFAIEPGFSETDLLWDPVLMESDSARDVRLGHALDEIFATDDATFVSITAHSGAITSILNVLGHRSFGLQTGGMIPIVVKVEFLPTEAPTTTVAPGSMAPTCTVNLTATASA